MAHRAKGLLAHASAGTLRTVVDVVLPLADAADAHERIESRRSTGKVFLRPERA